MLGAGKGMTWVGAWAVGSLTCLSVVSSPPSAAATPLSGGDVRCGTVVRHDLRLQHDVLGCAGVALVVARAHVRIDLNGHQLTGTGEEGSVGVQASGQADVRIENGTIRHFQVGALLQDLRDARLDRLEVVDTTRVGILLLRVEHSRIRRSTLRPAPQSDHSATGIQLFQSQHIRVVDNSLSHNGDGISLSQSDYNRVERNGSSDSGAGISLFDGSDHNVIALNMADANADTGILLDQHADHNLLVANRASHNTFSGIAVGASDDNVIAANVAVDNSGGGVAVVDNALRTVVIGNLATRNGFNPFTACVPLCPLLDDGVHIDAPQTTVARNITNTNADLGIEAVAGVTDGGRNRARDNGDVRQCVGVVCR